jgi:phenylalanyl-tRNA synthetase beta subunit
VTRDLNLVVDEAVRWADLAATVRAQCGPYFEAIDLAEIGVSAPRVARSRAAIRP